MGPAVFGYSVPVMGSNLRHGGRRRSALAASFCGALIASMTITASSGSALADDVPAEPEVLEQLARVYGKLGWRGDQVRALASLAQRFPDDVGALHAYLEALDEDGPAAEADKVAARIESGMVHINDQTVSDEAQIPFGGVGDSGTGSRFGGTTANIDAFTETQWVTMRSEPPTYPF